MVIDIYDIKVKGNFYEWCFKILIINLRVSVVFKILNKFCLRFFVR